MISITLVIKSSLKKIIQKFIAKFFNSTYVRSNPFIWDDFEKRLSVLKEQKIDKNLFSVTIGVGSKIYEETIIHNASNNKSKISIGNGTHIRGELLVQKYGGSIKIGDNSFVGQGTRIWSGDTIEIGDNVLISHNCNIIDTNSHEIDYKERAERSKELFISGPWAKKGSVKTMPIIIEDDVWISFNVTILKGVRLGKGSIIAANAVVTKDVPDFSLVVGNPGEVVKNINEQTNSL